MNDPNTASSYCLRPDGDDTDIKVESVDIDEEGLPNNIIAANNEKLNTSKSTGRYNTRRSTHTAVYTEPKGESDDDTALEDFEEEDGESDDEESNFENENASDWEDGERIGFEEENGESDDEEVNFENGNASESKYCYAYKCPICMVKTASFVDLAAHAFREHSSRLPQPIYACLHCGMVYPSTEDVQAHVDDNHADQPVACPLCYQKFQTLDQVRQHCHEVHMDSSRVPRVWPDADNEQASTSDLAANTSSTENNK